MNDYAMLKKWIEQRGVHAQLGPAGEGWGIEQNPHELATFLVRMQELDVQSVLEIGTGYKAGLARFLAQEMGWQVTTVDIQDYGHQFEGIEFITPTTPTHHTDRFGRMRSWDLLFIDGNHNYFMVELDYSINKDFATKAIAFHDIAGLRDCEGARNFWEKIRYAGTLGKLHADGTFMCVLEDPRCHQVIDDNSQAAGIGWIEL